MAQIFWTFLKLGCYAFGGPAAHLVLFHQVLVQQKKWLTPDQYSQLLALSQLLPGPTSSQVGLGIGYVRGGYSGAFAAWLGFSLPSLLLMLFAALYLKSNTLSAYPHALHAVKLIVLAVVIVAFWQMLSSFCQQWWQRILMLISTVLLLLWPHALSSVLVIVLGAACGIGLWQFKHLRSKLNAPAHQSHLHAAETEQIKTSTTLPLAAYAAQFAVLCMVLFVLLLLWSGLSQSLLAQTFSAFYQSGAMVFGGGHVVLPLLQQQFVLQNSPLQLDAATFDMGYALAQLMPGPLFSFAAYLGAQLPLGGYAAVNALYASVALFLPGMLLLLAALPYWSKLLAQPQLQHAVVGINAAVVALLLALILQMLQQVIFNWRDILMVVITVLLLKSKCPVWLSLILVFFGYCYAVS